MPPRNPDWTPARLQVLTDLWLAHTPVSDIIPALDHKFRRDQIIGKAHDLGLPHHNGASRPPAAGKLAKPPSYRHNNPQRVPDPQAYTTPADLVAADQAIPRYRRKTLATLKPGSCRWPVGDPRNKNFFFCGAARHGGHPYCAEHCRRAYVGFQS